MRRAAWLALAVSAAPVWAGTLDLGPDEPPAGQSLLAELFPEGLPAPFETLLDALRADVGAENVQTALVPLGRSLQRYAADPDYFASPRIVVAVTGDRAAGPQAPRLADRLFLGYQPAAGVVEAISHNESAGRFEFQEVVDYGAAAASMQPAERRVCVACHQGQGPVFARPLWSETNANPAVAERLAGLGATFHGAPVRTTVDALAAFDEATDRAALAAVADRLWQEGCPDAACRAALLGAAVRLLLGGGRGDWPLAAPAGFEAQASARWPDGLSVVSPDLKNRDPFLGDDPTDLETEGTLDPETPRPARVVWTRHDGFAGAARIVAAQFTPGDRAWIAGIAPASAPEIEVALACVEGACEGQGVRLAVRSGPDGRPEIRSLDLRGLPAVGRLAGADARLLDGRIVRVRLDGSAGTLTIVDDLAGLDAALAARARDGAAVLAAGPFRRRAVLALIADCLRAGNG